MIVCRKMNKKIILYILFFLSAPAFGQNVEKLFLEIPENLIPLLSKQNRFEMMEYYKANQQDSVKNKFGNYTKLELYDSINQHIVVSTTKNSQLEIKILNRSDSVKTIALINTILAPIQHSRISFYNSMWQKLSIDFLMPKATEWLKKDIFDKEDIDKIWISKLMDNSFVALNFEGENIIAKNYALETMSVEEKKQILPFIEHKVLIFELNDNKWITKKTL